MIKKLVPATSPLIVWDDVIVGLGCRVTSGGSKSFVLRYRNKNNVERRMTLGRWPALSVVGARELAKDAFAALRRGNDPLATRQADRTAITVSDLLDDYLKSSRFSAKATTTQSTDKGRIERHIRPVLGKHIAVELLRRDVEKMASDVTAGRTRVDVKTGKRGRAMVKGGAGTARKSVRLLSVAFAWAIEQGLVETNPAHGIKLGSDGRRDTIIDSAGYVAVFETLDRLEAEGEITSEVADAIRLIALTGARRSEVIKIQRSYIDTSRALIVLPSTRHKTGSLTGDSRIIGLPAEGMRILERQEGDPLFDFDPSVISKAWRVVRAVAQLPAGFGLHGLRHSLASHLAMGGASTSEIMVSLGHRQTSTTQRYVHFAQNARTGLAERAAAVAVAAMKKPDAS
jgi:integrase